MSFEGPKIIKVDTWSDRYNQIFTVYLDDGMTLCIPYKWYSRLELASQSQRRFVRITGGGIGLHWPDIDEDLSTSGLICKLKDRGLLPEASPGGS